MIKKGVLLLYVITLSLTCFAQVSYEKGYYVDNSGKKVECLIKNLDWRNNPTEFEYKLSDGGAERKATVNNVKEFGVYERFKYIRADVKIDKSRSTLVYLSRTKEVEFEQAKLFLRVLLEGKANLYYYEEYDIRKYFFNYEEQKEIKQLVYKRYKAKDNEVKENTYFRQQLLLELKCEAIQLKEVKYLLYFLVGNGPK